MTVHSPARMAGRNVGQLVGGLKAEAPPKVGVITIIQIDATVAGAVDTDAGEAGQIQACSQPAGQIFVGRRRQMLVEEGVIQRRHRRPQPLSQHIAFGPGNDATAGECSSNPSQEAVAVQTAGAVARRQDIDLPGCFEGAAAVKYSRALMAPVPGTVPAGDREYRLRRIPWRAVDRRTDPTGGCRPL